MASVSSASTLSARLGRFFNSEEAPGRLPWRLFAVALLVRVAYMTLAHTYRLKAADDHFGFGFEAGRIAAALVGGRGYADPFSNIYVQHTGPTAWLPPLYPLILAAVFKLFGVYTPASAWVILAFNCVCSAAVAPAVWALGLGLAGRRNALWAGWLWALHPAAMQYAVRWVWEMSLSTALFSWVLVLTLRMRAQYDRAERVRPALWALFGCTWGLLALSNSALVVVLPAAGLWVLVGAWKGSRASHADDRQRSDPWGSLACAGLAAILFLAVVTPWTVRNWQVFHAFVPLRGNFGAELYLGNGPEADGFLKPYNHPHVAAPQLRLYRQLGEVAYVRLRGNAARALIAADPGLFARNTLKRVYFFWWSVPHPTDPKWWNEPARVLSYGFISLSGLLGLALALRDRRPGAVLFGWAILLLPLPYYAVTVDARFRHPLEPLLCVLGVYLFQSARPRLRVAGVASRPRPV